MAGGSHHHGEGYDCFDRLVSDGFSPTEISRLLFCSRTTVYAVTSRFLREGGAAFDGRRTRGRRPLLGNAANERVEKLIEEDSKGRVNLHSLPSWSPQSNPVELVWWSMHEAVSRNHECSGLDDLVELAEGYLQERQPFGLKLGEVYERLERPPPWDRASVPSRKVRVIR